MEPTPRVLSAFGVGRSPEPIGGSEGKAWRAADTVLKPCEDEAEWSWLGQNLPTIREEGFRLALPVPARDGRWVVDGWCVQTALEGHEQDGRWLEVIEAGERFHAAARHLPRPAFLDARTHHWAIGDRVAWEEAEAPPGPNLLDVLLAARQPVELPSQLIHGDLTENVLFDEGRSPAIIDVTPYWRPAVYASAIVVADALVWGSSSEEPPTLPHQPSESDRTFIQLLIRALIFRLVADVLSGQIERLDAYLPVVRMVDVLAVHDEWPPPPVAEGDRVEWVGAPPRELGDPAVGGLGWVLADDRGNEWVVSWDRGGTGVYPGWYLRKVTDRNGDAQG